MPLGASSSAGPAGLPALPGGGATGRGAGRGGAGAAGGRAPGRQGRCGRTYGPGYACGAPAGSTLSPHHPPPQAMYT